MCGPYSNAHVECIGASDKGSVVDETQRKTAMSQRSHRTCGAHGRPSDLGGAP